jgi:hypothetical protein
LVPTLISTTSHTCLQQTQNICDTKAQADKDSLYAQVIENIEDKCEPGTETPLFNPALNIKMVAKAWKTATQYVKAHEAPFSSAPTTLRTILQKIHALVSAKAAVVLAIEKRKTEKRGRNILAEQRVGERSPTKKRGLETAVTALPTPPPSPIHSPPSTPDPPAYVPPATHNCLMNCKHECKYGGPGPPNWCRPGNHYSMLFIGPLRENSTPSTSCQRCACVRKAAERETKFKNCLGGTCSAYIDGTECQC